jgi:chemotaxis protein CheX
LEAGELLEKQYLEEVGMNVEFINPFINATINVLSTMGGVNPKPQKPHLKNGNRSYGEVTGIIGLAGKEAKGSFAVSFSRGCIEKIVSNMLGEDVQDLEQDIIDAVGEITNMISGGARAELENKGYSFEMAIPSIVSGKDHKIVHITDFPVIVVPFDTDDGPFFVEACLKCEK